jgi:hypothetical protein
MEKQKYKQILCKMCNKTYGVNYIYVHYKSKLHHKNIIRNDKKNELLNDDIDDDKTKECINDYIESIEHNLTKIKEYYNKII